VYELPQDRARCPTFVLVVLKFLVLLPQSCSVITELCCNSDCLSWTKMTNSSLKTTRYFESSTVTIYLINWVIVEIYSTCSQSVKIINILSYGVIN